MSVPGDPSATCGACAGARAVTPAEVTNRPGLPAIGYRIGTHATFLQTLLARLAADGPVGLATREPDDFTVALLDAWALVGDVLTFYQERTANEHYWRTATEPRSLLELSRLLGFAPRPGVAAIALLAFAVDRIPNGPATVPVPAGQRVQSVPGPGEEPQTFETLEPLDARPEWNVLRPERTTIPAPAEGDEAIRLAGVALDLRPGDGLLVLAGGRWAFRRLRRTIVAAATGATRVELETPLTWEDAPAGVALPDAPTVLALRLKAPLFGHNAPEWGAMADRVRARYEERFGTPEGDDWPGLTLRTIDSLRKPDDAPAPTAVHLDAGDATVAPGSLLVVAEGPTRRLFRVDSATVASRNLFALTARTLRLELSPAADLAAFDGSVRRADVHAAPEELPLAPQERTQPIAGRTITLDGTLDPPPAPGRRLVVRGVSARTGRPAGEVAVVAAAGGSPTVLHLSDDLREAYVPASLSLYANVVEASHGETVAEVLGSGDAARPFQAFRLSGAPLTYLPGGSDGARSTLEIWVDGVRWTEVTSFSGAGPRDRVHVTRRDDDGRTTVQFGDGSRGARLPSGVENVRARYRKGIGRSGSVRADALTLLVGQPLGVRSATNPLPAAGGEEPEAPEATRGAGPLAALTLGRVVTLADYRDFARGYPGIAKAEATWVWDGPTRGVALTVAGADGTLVPPDGPLASRLRAAIEAARDPVGPLHLRSYRPADFRLAAAVRVAADRDPDTVLAAVRLALATRFGFEARALGVGVSLAEVVAALHAVPGVIAANVRALHRPGTPAVPNAWIAADRPAPGSNLADLQGAELLLLDRDSLADVRAEP